MSNFSLNIAVTPLPSGRYGLTLLATGDNSALAIGGLDEKFRGLNEILELKCNPTPAGVLQCEEEWSLKGYFDTKRRSHVAMWVPSTFTLECADAD